MAAQFPPAPYDEAFKQIALWDGWYSNHPDELTASKGNPTHTHNGMPYRGGVVGLVSAGVWGVPVTPGENRSDLSIPVAGDLAQLSADLLFSESPKIVLPDSQDTAKTKAAPERKKAQARLELIVSSDAAHAELLRAGEYAAAHGSAYLAIVWDSAFREHVWFRAYRADCVIPEWKYGELSAATTWTEYVKKDDTYRLFAKHVPGSITYSLWRGGSGDQGTQVPLDTITEAAHYLKLVDVTAAEVLPEAASLDVTVRTGVPWLTIEYIPNMLPNPAWDKKGDLANLGRSDFFGLEPVFARINAIWSSLMRDFDNGMGRLTVPESYLKVHGPGQGAAFEMGRQVYSPVGGLVDDGKGGSITISQFEIRVQEHIDAINELKRVVAGSAGYSPAHLGLKPEGGTKTATEVTDDKQDSERTRDKKALYVRPALARLSRTALAIDGLVFPGKGGTLIMELPDIDFAEVSQINPLVRAQTVQILSLSNALSIQKRVQMAQPLLNSDEVDAEVALIKAENGIGPVPDPTKFTGDVSPTDATAV